MTQESLEDGRRRMDGAVSAYDKDMSGVRTGRASTGLVDNIRVDYHGTEMPLNQIAQINVGDARLLVIQPWDRSSVRSVVRAIQMADIGLQPSVDGDLIRIVVPPLTEERRRDIVKMVTRRAEEAKVAIRNVRRDVQGRIRSMDRDGEVSQDLARRAQDDLQKLTDDAVKMVDAASSSKEKEVMQV
jgi:ribosome recycling factor